jgi:choice-of-anchor A domain-containing protein
MGGGMAVGGNVTIGSNSWQVANLLNGEAVSAFPNSTTLDVVGTVTGGPLQLYNGNYYVPNATISNPGGGSSDGTTNPINFATTFSQFKSTSATIAGETQNANDSVSVNGSGQLQININDAGLNIINITAAQAATGNIDFVLKSGLSFASSTSASGNTWVIINVTGASPTLDENSGVEINGSGVQYGNTAYQAEDILYNFSQTSGTVTLKGTIVGSVLAPYMAVSDTSGQQIDGSLIAASFSGNAEFHNLNFLGPTFTPEPAPFAVVGLSLLGLAYFRKRRRA